MRVNRSRTSLVVATFWILGCSPDPPQEVPPPSGAPQIYQTSPTWCSGNCWTLTLYRSDTFIELRAHDGGDNTFLGLATGILSDPASDELDQLLDEAVDLGELPGDAPLDLPLIELSLPGLDLLYTDGYPPSGLAALDAFLAKVLDDMSQCHPTTKLTPDHDCEPLAPYPE